jgi:hypothetical protein
VEEKRQEVKSGAKKVQTPKRDGGPGDLPIFMLMI